MKQKYRECSLGCSASCERCGLVTETVERVMREMGLIVFPKSGIWGVLDRCDLYQSGMIGLMASLGKWSPDGGASFSTYAMGGVRQAVWNAMRAASGCPRRMRVPQPRSLRATDESVVVEKF